VSTATFNLLSPSSPDVRARVGEPTDGHPLLGGGGREWETTPLWNVGGVGRRRELDGDGGELSGEG